MREGSLKLIEEAFGTDGLFLSWSFLLAINNRLNSDINGIIYIQ